MNALIGSTGFVGSNLAAQFPFDWLGHSCNLEELRGRSFELVVCAGIQARKWWANQNPEADWAGIQRLLEVLATVRAQRFVLISTVDVYPHPAQVTEETPIAGEHHAYGRHRFAAEQFVRERFATAHVVRLPGLFGRGLKKNVIYDLLHRHELSAINPAGRYQYYGLDRLWSDLEQCVRLGLPLINFATEPLGTEEIVSRFFPELAPKLAPATAFHATYDMHTTHARAWNSPLENYLYSKAEVLRQLGEFLHSPV